jgi:hypothetical protein
MHHDSRRVDDAPERVRGGLIAAGDDARLESAERSLERVNVSGRGDAAKVHDLSLHDPIDHRPAPRRDDRLHRLEVEELRDLWNAAAEVVDGLHGPADLSAGGRIGLVRCAQRAMIS